MSLAFVDKLLSNKKSPCVALCALRQGMHNEACGFIAKGDFFYYALSEE